MPRITPLKNIINAGKPAWSYESFTANTYSVSTSASYVDEGSTLTVTVDTTDVEDGTVLYWTINADGSTLLGDFINNSGSFVIESNTGSFTVLPTADQLFEDPVVLFSVQIRKTSVEGTIIAETDDIELRDATYSVTVDSPTLNEGSSLAVTVATTGIPDDTVIYWKLVNENFQLLYRTTNPNAVVSALDNWPGCISMTDSYFAVGATAEDVGGLNSGSVYLFSVADGSLIHRFDNPEPSKTGFGSVVKCTENYTAVGHQLYSRTASNQTVTIDADVEFALDFSTGYTNISRPSANTVTATAVGSLSFILETDPQVIQYRSVSVRSGYLTISGAGAVIDFTNWVPSTTVWTAEGWFRCVLGASPSQSLPLLFLHDGSNGRILGLWSLTDGTILLQNASGIGSYQTTTNYSDGDVHHWSLVSNADGEIILRIDGIYQGQITHVGTAQGMTIGNYLNAVRTSFIIDGIRFSKSLRYPADNTDVTPPDYVYVSAISSVGKAYIFDNNTGELVKTIDNPVAEIASFGCSLGMNNDYLVIGAESTFSSGGLSGSGKLHVYSVPEFEPLYTIANPNDYGTEQQDYFGSRVAISNSYIISSSAFEDDASGTSSGKAYIFDITDGTLLYTLDNPNVYTSTTDDSFGNYIDISEDYFVVAAGGEDTPERSTGAVYVYDASSGNLLHSIITPSLTANSFASGTLGSGAIQRIKIAGDILYVSSNNEQINDLGQGKVYVYSLITGQLITAIDNPDITLTDYVSLPNYGSFGYTIDSIGDYLLVTSPYIDYYLAGGRVYLYKSVAGDDGSSFSAVTGSESIVGGFVNFSVTATADQILELPYAVKVAISLNETYDPIVQLSKTIIVNDTSRPTVTVTPSLSTVLEGESVTITVAVTSGNIDDGTILYYTSNGTAKLSTINSRGSFTISNNSASFLITTVDDYIIGTTSSFTVDIRNTNLYGPVIASSGTINIEDTGLGQVRYIDNPNAFLQATGDRFGSPIIMNDTYTIASSPSETISTAANSGVVYIFNNSDGTLFRNINIGASSGRQFGISLALDGDNLYIGCASGGTVYKYSIATGSQLATFSDPSGQSTPTPYYGLYINANSNYVVIGSPGYNGTGYRNGIAYVYDASTRSQLYTVNGDNGYNDQFPNAIGINNNMIVFGNSNIYSGNAYRGVVHTYSPSSGVSLERIDDPNKFYFSGQDFFGSAISINDYYCLIAAYGDAPAGSTDGGVVYIYKVNGEALDLIFTLDNPNPIVSSGSNRDVFGVVAMNKSIVAVGAYLEDDVTGTASDAGKAYLFDLASGLLLYTIDNPNIRLTSTNDTFGTLNMNDEYLSVSANREEFSDTAQTESGVLYQFNLPGTRGIQLRYDAAYLTSYSGSDTVRSIGAIEQAATLTNGVGFESDPACFTFDPNLQQYITVQITSFSNLRSDNFLGNDNSLEAWINFSTYDPTLTDATENQQGVIIWPGFHQGISISPTGVRFTLYRQTTLVEWIHQIPLAEGPVVDEWVHICHVCDYAESTATWYVNGIAVSTVSLPGFPGLYDNSLAFGGGYINFGAARNTASYRWYLNNGKIGAARIYSEALSAAEVVTNYNIGKKVYAPDVTVIPAASTVAEGSSLEFTVTAPDVPSGTTLWWKVSNNWGDFLTNSGSFVINNGTGTFSVTPTADGVTEYTKKFRVSVKYSTNEYYGDVLAHSPFAYVTGDDFVDMATLTLPSGVTLNTSNTKFTEQSLEFDGTQVVSGDLTFDLTARFTQQDSITIETWIYTPSGSNDDAPWSIVNNLQRSAPIIITSSSDGVTKVFGWYQLDRTGSSGSSALYGPAVVYDQWSLLTIEIEYNGSTTRVRRYLNGSTQGLPDNTLGVSGSTDYSMPGMPSLVLGNNGVGKWTGLIGPTKISKGILYNSTTCTVPTAEWVADDNTILIIQ